MASTLKLRSCVVCGESFETSSSNRKYCADRCRYRSQYRSAARERWHERNPGRQTVLSRESHLRKKYDEMLAGQGGVCAICGTTDTSPWASFCIDHNHATGAVRGLLCRACNTCIGQVDDQVDRLRAAISYLEERT